MLLLFWSHFQEKVFFYSYPYQSTLKVVLRYLIKEELIENKWYKRLGRVNQSEVNYFFKRIGQI